MYWYVWCYIVWYASVCIEMVCIMVCVGMYYFWCVLNVLVCIDMYSKVIWSSIDMY